jgi:hypothetical protein
MVKSNELDFWVKCDKFESEHNNNSNGTKQQDN